MEVARSKNGISVSQRKYTLDLLQETRILGCKPVDTPMENNRKLGIQLKICTNGHWKVSNVSREIYLSNTCLDISFLVSQFMKKPNENHMKAVSRILHYLKKTPGKGLFFQKGAQRGVENFSEADWARSIVDRRSTTGYCTLVRGNLLTWKSKKQTVVSRSSAEAEFRNL